MRRNFERLTRAQNLRTGNNAVARKSLKEATRVPTVDEALQYMGIDYADGVVLANVNRALGAAVSTLKGAVGADVLDLMPDDERVKELALVYTDDLYSERGVSAKVSNATRLSVASMELQVKLELRGLRAAAAEEAGA